MNSFELNKIFGAILGVLVLVMGVGFLAEAIYRPIEDRGVGFALPEPEDDADGAPAEEGEATAEADEALLARLQTASVTAGERAIARCQSCHDYSPANADRVGPGLYDIVGDPIARSATYGYSDALEAHGNAGEIWDYANLDAFLAGPAAFAPGTRMNIPPLNEGDRADLIVFLRSLSEDPFPLEEAPAGEDAPAEEAPAEEAPAEEAPAEEAAEPEAPEEPEASLEARLEEASAEEGERLIGTCQACHDYSPENATRVGPGLYGIVEDPVARSAEYDYSDALQERGDAGEVWDPETLDAFLAAPTDFAPGTRMAIPGVAAQDRAHLIAFLSTLEDDAAVEEAPAEEAPAEAPVEEEAPAEEAPVEEAPVEEAPAEEAAPEADEAAVEDEASPEFAALMAEGQASYQRHCVACHGAEGQGGAGTPIANNGFVGMTRPVLGQIIHGGAYMPAFLSLSDQELAAVTTYIRNSFGNSFGPVTEEEVQSVR